MNPPNKGCSKVPLEDVDLEENVDSGSSLASGSDYDEPEINVEDDQISLPRTPPRSIPAQHGSPRIIQIGYLTSKSDSCARFQIVQRSNKKYELLPVIDDESSDSKKSEKAERTKNKKSANLRINPLVFSQKMKQEASNDDDSVVTSNSKESETVVTEFVKFHVQAIVKKSSSRGPKIIELTCEPEAQPNAFVHGTPPRDSFSSGNLADVSQTQSSESISPVSQIPLPPAWAARASQISSSSSGSSLPASAAKLAFQQGSQKMTFKQTRCLSPGRIEELKLKWHKGDMIYHILDFIDRCAYGETDNVKDGVGGVKPGTSSRKRSASEDRNKPPKKRKRNFHLDPGTCSTVSGTEVFAKCEDGNYYHGIVSGVTKTGELDVDFSDIKHLCVEMTDIITNVQSLVNQSVMILSSPGEAFYPALVSEYISNCFPCKFSVISDYGDCIISGREIFLTQAQASSIGEFPINTTNNDISVPGPSGTGPSGICPSSSEMGPGPNGINARPGPSGISPGPSGVRSGLSFKNTNPTETSSDSDVPLRRQTDMNIYKYVVGCDMEAANAGLANSLLKLKGIAGKVPKRSNQEEDRILGPLTASGNWFSGLNFILTCSLQNLLNADIGESESSDTNNTDSEDYVFSKVPFVGDRLAQQIRLAGGRVLTTFEELDSALYPQTYLVTNRPCATARFLKCLALGITIACHEWIINCTLKQKRLMIQELPAGWSAEKREFISMYRRRIPRPFNGLRIQLAQYNDPNFIRFWSEICRLMGANVTSISRLDRSSNVLVAENGYRDILLDEALAVDIPVVSVAWIVQSLIHGESRPYRAHATYDHLYEETWEF